VAPVPAYWLLDISNKLTFDLESGVMWATSVPVLVFLGLSVFKLGPMYATDKQMSDKSIA